MPIKCKIKEHDWSDIIHENLFIQLIVQIATVIIIYINLVNTNLISKSFISHPVVVAISFIYVFIRNWKTVDEEKRTCETWDHFLRESNRFTVWSDQVLEAMYILLTFTLPIFSISFPILLIALFLYYLVCYAFDLIFIVNASECRHLEYCKSDDNYECFLKKYFININKIELINLVIVIVAGLLFWLCWYYDKLDSFITYAAFTCMASLLAIELLIEPFINHKYHDFAPEDLDDEDIVTIIRFKEEFNDIRKEYSNEKNKKEIIAKERNKIIMNLSCIHKNAFEYRERYDSLPEMIKQDLANTSELWLIKVDDTIRGYQFLKIDEKNNTAYLWYLAIDGGYRGLGLGKRFIRQIVDYIKVTYNSVNYIFWESKKPENVRDANDDDVRRMKFYLSLKEYIGLVVYWVKGIDYSVPSKLKPSINTNKYNILFMSLLQDNAYTIDEVIKIIQMMHNSYKDYNNSDLRIVNFGNSLNNINIQKYD